VAPYTDHRRLDLQLDAPSTVDWSVSIPEGASAEFRTSVAMHPVVRAVGQADGVDVLVAVRRRGDSQFDTKFSKHVQAQDRSPEEIRFPVTGDVTIRIRVSGRDNPAYDTVLFDHPVIDVERPDHEHDFGSFAPALDSSNREVDLDVGSDAWSVRHLVATGRTFDGAVEYRQGSGSKPGSLNIQLDPAPCAGSFAAIRYSIRLEDPWGSSAYNDFIPRASSLLVHTGKDEPIEYIVPYRLRFPFTPQFDEYFVPLRQLGLSGTTRIEAIELRPAARHVPDAAGIAAIGFVSLVEAKATVGQCSHSDELSAGASRDATSSP
jgi:hypothetical protein